MKVISSAEMARIETVAYGQGVKPSAFMAAAGREIALYVERFIRERRLAKVVILLCGKGNNGGDAYVAGTHLHREGFAVTVYQLESIDKCSPLCKQSHALFVAEGGKVVEVSSALDFVFPRAGVVIDALFGTGFHGAAEGLFAAAIIAANGSRLPILAVDIPSGLNGKTGEASGPVITATETLFLGLPKTGFFMRDGWNAVGELVSIDFGLGAALIEEAQEDFILLTDDLIAPLRPTFKRTQHKYEAGLVVGLAGSPGMPGAALLASLAALRGGCGLVRLLHPEGMQVELSNSPYELIKIPYTFDDSDKVTEKMREANGCFIGPGLGKEAPMQALLAQVLKGLDTPCVIDADALPIAAALAGQLPKNSVFTPHRGEMRRLLNEQASVPLDLNWLRKCQDFAERQGVTLVLKGAPSFILHPKEQILVSTRGDPGMATAGSGDVLTGLIAALLAHGLQGRDAAALGVYLHGIAGERAARARSSSSLIASDLINFF